MNATMIKDVGYLILRLGIGAMMARHGWPKIIGGTEKWESLGENLSVIGIHFLPVFWGFCAAVSEFIGGICIAIGFVFRPACALVLFTMLIAVLVHFHDGGSFGDWAESAEMGIVALAMLLMGPGKYSLNVSMKK